MYIALGSAKLLTARSTDLESLTPYSPQSLSESLSISRNNTFDNNSSHELGLITHDKPTSVFSVYKQVPTLLGMKKNRDGNLFLAFTGNTIQLWSSKV